MAGSTKEVLSLYVRRASEEDSDLKDVNLLTILFFIFILMKVADNLCDLL